MVGFGSVRFGLVWFCLVWFGLVCLVWFGRLENLSGGCHCCDCCDGGKTKSTPSLGFRLRLDFDKRKFVFNNLFITSTVLTRIPHSLDFGWLGFCVCLSIRNTD